MGKHPLFCNESHCLRKDFISLRGTQSEHHPTAGDRSYRTVPDNIGHASSIKTEAALHSSGSELLASFTSRHLLVLKYPPPPPPPPPPFSLSRVASFCFREGQDVRVGRQMFSLDNIQWIDLELRSASFITNPHLLHPSITWTVREAWVVCSRSSQRSLLCRSRGPSIAVSLLARCVASASSCILAMIRQLATNMTYGQQDLRRHALTHATNYWVHTKHPQP